MTPSLRPPIVAPAMVLRFRRAWTYIDGVRELGRTFCEQTFTDPSVADRARMVLQETLENAVKYSVPEADDALELMIRSDGQRLSISCSSHPDADHLAKLRTEVDQLRTFDSEAAYLAAFQRAAREPHATARLGLARIRFEGRFDLELSDHVDGRIRLTATTRL